jgi:hypothetical protein
VNTGLGGVRFVDGIPEAEKRKTAPNASVPDRTQNTIISI